ncbi:acid-sensing (proton-gated) ion channel [Cichlidogyrus casuarinus]|uniref:Acid-sensing (Proton-gated) ion channel n=1 Tax=Cichlidogyrus casuarinus TaxID=1844966 RepID=A0ABD2PYU2_9PLAT
MRSWDLPDESFGGRLTSTIFRFSKKSTVHGFNHLAQARTVYRRLFWLLISLCASLGFMINVYYLFEKFNQVPVLTNTLHDAHRFEFPDITFCQLNPYYFPPKDSKKREKMYRYIDNYTFFETHVFSLPFYDYLCESQDLGGVDLSHPTWSSVLTCEFKNDGDCNYTYFKARAYPPYASCYTFHPYDTYPNITRAIRTNDGSDFNAFRPDLKMIIYKSLQLPEKYQTDPHKNIFMPSGVLLIVHEKDTYPFFGDSIIVDGGTQVEIRVTKVHHLETLGKCNADKEYVNYTLKEATYGKYWANFKAKNFDCFVSQTQRTFAKTSDCQMPRFPRLAEYGHLKSCRLMDKEKLKNFDQKSLDKIQADHKCQMDLCVHDDIRMVIAQSAFPSVKDRHTQLTWLEKLAELEARERKAFENKSDLAEKALYLNESHPADADLRWACQGNRTDLLNLEFVERNFMMLRIKPASFFMDEIAETEEYPLSRLVSDVGGSVGLWIGASLITIFEGFDLLLEIIDTILAVNRQRRQRKRENIRQLKHNYLATAHQPYSLAGITLWDDEAGSGEFIEQRSLAGKNTLPPTPPYYRAMRAKQKSSVIEKTCRQPLDSDYVPIYYLESNNPNSHPHQKALPDAAYSPLTRRKKDPAVPLAQYDYI